MIYFVGTWRAASVGGVIVGYLWICRFDDLEIIIHSLRAFFLRSA